MAKALDALIKFYRTGESPIARPTTSRGCRTRRRRSTPSTASSRSIVDPRGIKGSWEGLVFYVNQEKTQRIKTIANNAQWFEDHMPWDAKYRKASVQGIVANAIDVIVETGDSAR
jgi:dipeptidyl-peptidase-3